MACGCSRFSSVTLPMSCSRPARRALRASSPSSAAISDASLAVSTECASRFWPYDERYFMRPTMRTNSGWMPCSSSSSTAASPDAWMSVSTSSRTSATISSMRDGWMRPSASRRTSACRAISRRTESKPETRTASGVSSTITSTPVSASNERMLRPSRPMIRPLRSSVASGTDETVCSMVVVAARRWMDFRITFCASR